MLAAFAHVWNVGLFHVEQMWNKFLPNSILSFLFGDGWRYSPQWTLSFGTALPSAWRLVLPPNKSRGAAAAKPNITKKVTKESNFLARRDFGVKPCQIWPPTAETLHT
jgi:hypothetical protein